MMDDFIAIGNEQLGKSVEKGDMIECPVCGEQHPLEYAKDQNGEETSVAGFIKCPENGRSYLVSIRGQLIK
jgi:hypothetical protein